VYFAEKIGKKKYDRLRFEAELHGRNLKGAPTVGSGDNVEWTDEEKQTAKAALSDAQKRVQQRIKDRNERNNKNRR